MPSELQPAAPRHDLSGAQDDAHLVDLWLRTCPSPHTRAAHVRGVRSCLEFLGQPSLQALTLAHLLDWRQQLVDQGLAVSSVNRRLAAMRSLLSFAQRTGYLVYNVGAALQALPAPDRLAERILTEADTLQLLQAAGAGTPQAARNLALLRFLYYTGCRLAEACALQWRDVQDLTGARAAAALHGKGGRTRHVALPPACAAALAELQPPQPDPEGPVFRTRSGRALQPRNAQRVVSAAARRAGLEAAVSPHWLRHAHASHALDRGAAAHQVQRTLGPCVPGHYHAIHARAARPQ